MFILGINAGHNSSAVLMKDNKIIFGVHEERITKIKNQPGFPLLSIKAALDHARIKADDIDLLAVGGKSQRISNDPRYKVLKFESKYNKIKRKWFGESENIFMKLLKKSVSDFNQSRSEKKVDGEKRLLSCINESGMSDKFKLYDHHSCHAASAYYGLRQKRDNGKYLIFTMDGGGDGNTSAVYIGENGRLERIASSSSFSPAYIYAHITYILGLIPNEHEYKLMGLAPYAQNKYAKIAKDAMMRFVDFDKSNPLVFTNGSDYPHMNEHNNSDKKRIVEDIFKMTLNMRFDTLSAGLQLMAEDVAVKWIKAGIAKTGIRKVMLSGGFFMNVKVNKLISELPEVEFVNVFPSCGDETNAFGAAFLAYQDFMKEGATGIEFEDFCIGPDASFDIEEAKTKYKDKVNFQRFDDINGKIVELLIDRKIVARASGGMEFGARALGNRSILASPDDMRIINKINAAIKKRDFWMPFAPAVLEEKLETVVDVPGSLKKSYSPYMMFTFDVKPEMQDKIIAGVHQADKTARAQTVNPRIYPDFHDIISRFEAKTGIPAVLNTSFNLHGFPIVLGACDAIDVYLNSELDVLVVGEWLVTRK